MRKTPFPELVSMPCLHDESTLSEVVPKTPIEALPRCSQQNLEQQTGTPQAALSPEASLESTQNVRVRCSHIKMNELQFAICIFQHVGINGAVVPLFVQKSHSLSHYVRKPLLGQKLISVVDLGAGQEDSSYEMLSGPADEGPMAVLVHETCNTEIGRSVFDKVSDHKVWYRIRVGLQPCDGMLIKLPRYDSVLP